MDKSLVIDKQTILNNIISFCSNDVESGNELFQIIQKSVADSLNALTSCFKKHQTDEFIRNVHKLRFSLSVLKIGEIHEHAIYIDTYITKDNFNDKEQQEIMLQFISEIEALSNELNH